MRLRIIIFLTVMSSLSICQVEMNYEMLNYVAAQQPNPDPNDRAAVKQQFQAYFIKQVFLKNIFQSNHLFYNSDNNQDYGLVNELMINQFADYLTEANFIDLSDIIIDE